MTDNAIVSGEFVTYSHLKTRKTFSIVIEFPEEQALHVLNTLGSPIGGNSKPVAIALLNQSNSMPFEQIKFESEISGLNQLSNCAEKTEGEKLRVRAIMLCKDSNFQDYARQFFHQMPGSFGVVTTEIMTSHYIKYYCNIKSRSELATNVKAQANFKELLEKYKDWQFENNYADNLSR